MITYTLSNGQRKELLVRGCPLEIVIPLGGDLDPDPMEFAIAAIPEDHEWITAAEIGDVYVVRSNSPGLVYWLGQIIDYSPHILAKSVNVVAVTLTPPRPRNAIKGPMWPGRAYIDGVEKTNEAD
jgi:hypothetical protein